MKTENSICQVCSKGFYRRPSAILRNNTYCCSRECSSLLRSQWMKGAGNHQFGLKGEANSSFKSDSKISNYGYLLVRSLSHPLSNSDGFLFAHRAIIEEYLIANDPGSLYLIDLDGRQVLSPDIIVHHNDGNKLNNTISNLSVMDKGDHVSLHNKERNIIRNTDGTFSKLSYTKLGGVLTKSHPLDAGYDVASSEDIIVYPESRSLVSTELRVEVPEGFVGLLWSRSGLSTKHGIEVGAGCIDCGYTGEVKVVLYNHSFDPFIVKKGDRIAQLLTVPISLVPYKEGVAKETERGQGGFGSTGV